MIGAATRHIHLLREIGRETGDVPEIVMNVVGVVIEITGQGEKTPETVLGGGEMVLLTRNQRAEETTAGTAVPGKTLVVQPVR